MQSCLYLMNNRIFNKIIKKIEIIAREFFWNHDESRNKMNLIGWQYNYLLNGGGWIRDQGLKAG